MSVAKVSEISATSSKSFEDAIQQGLTSAAKRSVGFAAPGSRSSTCGATTARHGVPGEHDGDVRARRLNPKGGE